MGVSKGVTLLRCIASNKVSTSYQGGIVAHYKLPRYVTAIWYWPAVASMTAVAPAMTHMMVELKAQNIGC